jgi:hypothetical protein
MREVDPYLIEAIDRIGEPVLRQYEKDRTTERGVIIDLLSSIYIASLEQGRFGPNRENRDAINSCIRELKQMGYEYSDYALRLGFGFSCEMLADEMMRNKKSSTD